MDIFWVYVSLIVCFVLGYTAILAESWIRVNKAASALLAALASWFFLFFVRGGEKGASLLGGYLDEVAQLIFFIFGAMTLVELINAHGGFSAISRVIARTSRRYILCVIGVLTFFFSSVLDNLTTTIVMISLLRQLMPAGKERLFFGALVVIAANAGGAWTPIGDVTTTMLWIQGKISSIAIMEALFLPSLGAFIAALGLTTYAIAGPIPLMRRVPMEKIEHSQIVLSLGILALISVPVLKALYGIPPFLGVLFGVALLWVVTDLMYSTHTHRQHLRVQNILTQVDTSGVLFFLGILLGVDALDAVGLLHHLAEQLQTIFGHVSIVAIFIGFLSALIDNIPLIAATLGMYGELPLDDPLWHQLAYCAGTGGSLLPIGSAAGIVFMQMEKVHFIWYLRNITPIACASYLIGVLIYFMEWII